MSHSRAAGPAASRPPRRELLVLVAIGLLPWTVIAWPGGVQFVALWGLLNPATLHVVSLPEYLFVLTAGLPDRLLAWPASGVLYAAGLAATVAGWWARADVRLRAGLFGLAAIAHLGFAVGVATRGAAEVVPVGPVLVAVAIWWFHWPTIQPRIARER